MIERITYLLGENRKWTIKPSKIRSFNGKKHADQVAHGIKALSDKLQTKVTDPDLAHKLVLDLREAALAVQKQNLTTQILVDQMAQYIHRLESHVSAMPQAPQ